MQRSAYADCSSFWAMQPMMRICMPCADKRANRHATEAVHAPDAPCLTEVPRQRPPVLQSWQGRYRTDMAVCLYVTHPREVSWISSPGVRAGCCRAWLVHACKGMPAARRPCAHAAARWRGRVEGWREGLHGRPMQTARILQCCSTHQSVPCATCDTRHLPGVPDIKAC